MFASLVVRDLDGKAIYRGEPVPVDRDSVVRESHRLRERFGRWVSIDSSEVISARLELRRKMEDRELLLSA